MKDVRDIVPSLEVRYNKKLSWTVDSEGNITFNNPEDEKIVSILEMDGEVEIEDGEVILKGEHEEGEITLLAEKYLVEASQEHQLNNWTDFWDEFEEKNLIEIIRKNYIENIEEKQNELQSIKFSDSIMSIPYKIEKKWKLFKWDKNGNMLTDIDGVLLDVPYFLTKNYEIFAGNYEIKDHKVNLLDVDEEKELWAPTYYIHNSLIINRTAEFLGITNSIIEVDRYSKKFLNMLKGLWFVLVKGPTIKNIEIAIYIYFGLPITLEDEKITKISSEQVITNKNEWTLKNNEIPWNHKKNKPLEEGEKIKKYEPLTRGIIEISDYIIAPEFHKQIEKYTYAEVSVKEGSFDHDVNIGELKTFFNRFSPNIVGLTSKEEILFLAKKILSITL